MNTATSGRVGRGAAKRKAHKLCQKLQHGGHQRAASPDHNPANMAVINTSGHCAASFKLFRDLHMGSRVLLMNDAKSTKLCDS